MKSVLIGCGALGAALLMLGGIRLFPLFSAMASTHPVKTGPIHENVIAIKSMSNLYIVSAGKDKVLIDAGANRILVKSALKKLNIAPESIKSVFLTHCDTDHTAALPLFKEAQIYLSIDEEPFITGEKKRRFIKALPVKEYRTINDGSIINLGALQIKCISTPGHTPGSMSYLINNELLFTGDTLGLENGKATVFSDFFNMDTGKQKVSIRSLAELTGISLLCTGHHGISSDFDKAMADWRN